jgi:hypothetical protein
MLAEIDKDARDIAILQKENDVLKSEMHKLQEKVQYLLELDNKRDVPILLDEETMEEVVLEPFDEIKGRRLYHAPIGKGKKYVAGTPMSITKVYGVQGQGLQQSKVGHRPAGFENEFSKGCCGHHHDDIMTKHFKKKYKHEKELSWFGIYRKYCFIGQPLNYCPYGNNQFDFDAPINFIENPSSFAFALYLVEAV